MSIRIEQLKQVSEQIVEVFNRLLPQLDAGCRKVNYETLDRMVKLPDTCLLIACNDTGILGALTLIMTEIPTGRKGYIEDVVVDQAARGQGVGRLLMEAAIALAKENDLEKIELTSRPERLSANRLYQHVGFRKRDTNAYQLRLQK